MTQRRFSPQELYSLRNEIPVCGLIEKVLYVPSRVSEGVFRFLCPLCGEFNTSVNFKKNLARCFCCEKNFNTIDLVMIIEKMDFLKAVHFLKGHRKKLQSHSIAEITEDQNKSPQHIADIIKSIIPSKPDIRHSESIESVSRRVLSIEQKLEHLSHQIDIISKSLV
jgi:DNA primase